jgi:hypothetical protein
MSPQNLTERFAALRNDFPILAAQTDGASLAYLDSASTSQKPWQVVTALFDFLTGTNANIHRGIYGLSLRASDAYDGARATAARFLNAATPEVCIFVRNTTEAINLVAQTWGRQKIGPGDLIVATVLEHVSNLVPGQMLANERGAELALAGITAAGQLDLDHLFSRVWAWGPFARTKRLDRLRVGGAVDDPRGDDLWPARSGAADRRYLLCNRERVRTPGRGSFGYGAYCGPVRSALRAAAPARPRHRGDDPGERLSL